MPTPAQAYYTECLLPRKKKKKKKNWASQTLAPAEIDKDINSSCTAKRSGEQNKIPAERETYKGMNNNYTCKEMK